MDSLEQVLVKEDSKLKKTGKALWSYTVDMVSGNTFYTTVYGLQELAFFHGSQYLQDLGMDIPTEGNLEGLFRTRLIGLAAGLFFFKPIGMARNYVANKMQVNKDSSLINKVKVNLAAITPIQAVVYAGMLAGGATWAHYSNTTGNDPDLFNSVVETLSDFPIATWVAGTFGGAIYAFPYGQFNDWCRKKAGVKPAIADSE